jgi:hypothetical protein
MDVGPRGEWPLELLLALARALAAPGADDAGDTTGFASLPGLEVWQLARAALASAASIPDALAGDRPPLADPVAERLRYGWRVSGFRLRAGALVNRFGRLAQADEDDTFLAPFRVAWDAAEGRPRLALVLEPPDVIARGELRRRLLEQFRDDDELESAAEALAEATGTALAADDLRRWCDPDRAQAAVLRVDRREDSEEYLLVLTGTAGGVPVAALVVAETVTVLVRDGRMAVESFDDVDVLFAGARADARLAWKEGGRSLADTLSILLRWRALLP